MYEIKQTIEIPANRRITLDVPSQIPIGATASFKLIWFHQEEQKKNLDTALDKIWELCKDSPITVDSFLEMRRKDNELEEKQSAIFHLAFST